MTEFMKPNITVEQVGDNIARFVMEPLERGYGQTLGNGMRRVLLSSLDGAAATAIKIEGVQHEFTSAPGVVEDVTDIVLNIKGLVFAPFAGGEEATATLSAQGPCVVTGADLEVPTEFQLINPEHVIATLSEGAQLEMSVRIGVGRGYVPAERNKRPEDPIASFRSIRCSRRSAVAPWTSRTPASPSAPTTTSSFSRSRPTARSAPVEAVCQSANIINQHMMAFLSLDESGEEVEVASIFAPEGPSKNTELEKQIEDLDLSVRSYNCLKRAGIHSVRQLVEYSENDLLNIRNFGAKSIEEVKDKLQSMDLSLKL